ncbi:uncharacterized protein LOC122017805 isoform X2 [Zingiber officinale]|uniref:uncharacterized protein LOC122017805 isoform X2 n=1 Tax=Zingiber officinale TaxID=94328 RepID=UPI001C4D398B|nr:uncharacterized protein LOC122017805 isoform X2 [Zingiber officinale]
MLASTSSSSSTSTTGVVLVAVEEDEVVKAAMSIFGVWFRVARRDFPSPSSSPGLFQEEAFCGVATTAEETDLRHTEEFSIIIPGIRRLPATIYISEKERSNVT